MIERFSQSFSADDLIKSFGIERPDAYQPNYNAAPTQLIPVITHESPMGLSYFYWGQAPRWAKNKALAEKMINVRAELIADKPVMIKAMKSHRCVIPMDGFYAWKKVGKKTLIPWRFFSTHVQSLSIAGLWEEYEDEGEHYHTFSLLTTAGHPTVAEVTERQPFVLNLESMKTWINKNATPEELIALLKVPQQINWTGYSVSPQLNDLSFNKPSLLKHAPAADQFGNLTLFD